MQERSGYKPKIINSASKFSGCIQTEKSKIILALPTNNTQMEAFDKTVVGGFSCVNTRLSFDTEILMRNLTKRDYRAMNIDKSFKTFKRNDLKVAYLLRLSTCYLLLASPRKKKCDNKNPINLMRTTNMVS